MEGQGVYSPKEQYKQMFIEAVGKRSGSMVMWQVLDEIGFFNSPASANHHLNVPGGLLIHSLNVAKAAMELCEAEQFAQCDKNVVLTAALLHDVCKAGKYIAKPEGGYRYRDTRMLGHGEESVILIQHWMYLTEKETLATRQDQSLIQRAAGFDLGNSGGIGYSEECSPTLMTAAGGNKTAVVQNQRLMESLVLNDQGGKNMDVSVNVTGTLRAQTHGHPPVVFQKSEDEGNET